MASMASAFDLVKFVRPGRRSEPSSRYSIAASVDRNCPAEKRGMHAITHSASRPTVGGPTADSAPTPTAIQTAVPKSAGNWMLALSASVDLKN
jgi:hypothetical protein